MKFNPPMLTEGPVSGRVYVVTHGKVIGTDDENRELIEATVKYDVTEQFEALAAKRAATASPPSRTTRKAT